MPCPGRPRALAHLPTFLLFTAALAPAAPARAADFEVGPWLGWAAGSRQTGDVQREVFLLNAGVDTTAPAWFFGSGYGGAWEVRMGPWLALQLPTDGQPFGEGGLTMILTQTEHASWGTFGLRVGGGHGGAGETYVTGTLWGGVRYVPARARENRSSSGPIAKATGVRIVATYQSFTSPVESGAIVFGIELEPDFFLPPYSLFKWGGKHGS